MPATIFDHGVKDLLVNIGLGFSAPLFMGLFAWIISRPKFTMILWPFFGLIALLAMPNALYLAYELRHIIQIDHIADNRTLTAWLFYGSICVLGSILSVTTVLIAVRLILPRQIRIESIIVLAYLSAYGTAMGKVRVNSWDLIFSPKKTFHAAQIVAASPDLRNLTLGLAMGLGISCLIVNHLVSRKTEALEGRKERVALPLQ